MRQVHGWSDEITMEEGLQETLDWVDANLSTLKTLPWSYQHKTCTFSLLVAADTRDPYWFPFC